MTKVRGLFIHPGQVDAIMAKHPAIDRAQVVVTRKEHKDEMTLESNSKKKSPRSTGSRKWWSDQSGM